LVGKEYDDGDDSRFNNFKLLTKTDIKKLEELFILDVEPEITEKDNCIKAEILI